MGLGLANMFEVYPHLNNIVRDNRLFGHVMKYRKWANKAWYMHPRNGDIIANIVSVTNDKSNFKFRNVYESNSEEVAHEKRTKTRCA